MILIFPSIAKQNKTYIHVFFDYGLFWAKSYIIFILHYLF